MKAINLTFKNNKAEQELFLWLTKRTTNKSAFIKDLLMQRMLEESKSKKAIKGFLTLE